MAPQPVNPWQVVYGTRAAHLHAPALPYDDTRVLIAALRAWRNETYSSDPPGDQRTANLIVTLTRTLGAPTCADPTPGLWTLTRALHALNDAPSRAPGLTLPLEGLDWHPVTPGAHHGTYARLTGDSGARSWYHLPDPHSAATLDVHRRGDTLHAELHIHAAPEQPIPLHAEQAVQDTLSLTHPDVRRISARVTINRHRAGLNVSLQGFLNELRRQLH